MRKSGAQDVDSIDFSSPDDNPLHIFETIAAVSSKDENLLKYASPCIHEILATDRSFRFSVSRPERKLTESLNSFSLFIVFIEVNIRNSEGFLPRK